MINTRQLRTPRPVGSEAADRPPVLVPARDEAARVDACVRSAGGPVIVLDDGSRDGTAEVAAAAGATVLRGSDPPPGWLGKAWACAQLAEATGDEVLVFVDADVRLAPGAVPAAVALLDAYGLDVVCPFPHQRAEGWAERLVQPLLQWSWLTTLPLRLAERSPRPSLTAACGQFLVVRRAALERAGGFAAVRGEVLDDLALVRAIKAAGGRGGVADGTHVASCRMYSSWAELRDGYGKSLWTAFPRPVLALLLLAYVVPAVAALRGSRLGALGYLAGVGSRVLAARRFGGRAGDAFAHPLSITTLAYLKVRSDRLHWRRALAWKGRPLPA